jgi:hypothetical protein
MNNRALAFSFLTLLTAMTASAASPVTDYSGKWSFDAAASKGLPPMFADITVWKLTVSQDARELHSAVHIENSRVPTMEQTFVYALDGSETKTTTAIVTPDGPQQVPTKLQAHLRENGSIVLTITRDFAMGDETIHAVTSEEWELGADGKTLTIHRHDSGPRKADMDLVFRR